MLAWTYKIERNRQTFLLRIIEECLEAIKKADHKVQLEVKGAKLKVFCSAKPNDDRDPIDSANEMLEEIGSPMEREPLRKWIMLRLASVYMHIFLLEEHIDFVLI